MSHVAKFFELWAHFASKGNHATTVLTSCPYTLNLLDVILTIMPFSWDNENVHFHYSQPNFEFRGSPGRVCIGGNIIDPSSWKGMEWNQLSAAIGALLSSAIDARPSSVMVARFDFDEYEPRRTGHCCCQGLLGPDTASPRRRRAGPPDPVLPTASFAGGGELAPHQTDSIEAARAGRWLAALTGSQPSRDRTLRRRDGAARGRLTLCVRLRRSRAAERACAAGPQSPHHMDSIEAARAGRWLAPGSPGLHCCDSGIIANRMYTLLVLRSAGKPGNNQGRNP